MTSGLVPQTSDVLRARTAFPSGHECPSAVRPEMAYLSVTAVRADAVFLSGLQRRDKPSGSQVRQAVTATIRAFGCSGCAARVAQEFGDHPETAVIRMRWARSVAREAFAGPAPQPGPGADGRADIRRLGPPGRGMAAREAVT